MIADILGNQTFYITYADALVCIFGNGVEGVVDLCDVSNDWMNERTNKTMNGRMKENYNG